MTMYIYCAYPAKSKSPKQLLTCLKISETSVILKGCHGVNYHDRAYTGTVSFRCSTWMRYQKNYILVSGRMQQKLSSQCNMTAQIDPVQDNNRYFTQWNITFISPWRHNFAFVNYCIVRLFVIVFVFVRSLECKSNYTMITTNAHIIRDGLSKREN
jgi:hypothetical protein